MQQWLVGLRDQRLMALALSSAETAVKLRPELPDSHRALALAGALVKRISVAVNAARKALEIPSGRSPVTTFGWVWPTAAMAPLRDQRRAGARPVAGPQAPLSGRSGRRRGRSEAHAGRMRASLGAEPGRCLPLLLMGMMQTGEGKLDEAIATYQRVLKINRHAGLAHGALARLYFRKGQTGLAQDALRQAFALDYRVAELMREQAAAYQQAGKLEGGREGVSSDLARR